MQYHLVCRQPRAWKRGAAAGAASCGPHLKPPVPSGEEGYQDGVPAHVEDEDVPLAAASLTVIGAVDEPQHVDDARGLAAHGLEGAELRALGLELATQLVALCNLAPKSLKSAFCGPSCGRKTIGGHPMAGTRWLESGEDS